MARSLLLVVPAITAIAAWLILDAAIALTTVLGLLVSGAGLWLATRPAQGGLSGARAAAPRPLAAAQVSGATPLRLVAAARRNP